MKILIASSLKRRLYEKDTSSRTRIIFELATGLINKGHKVSILATADSVVPGAEIIPVITGGYLDKEYENAFYAEASAVTLLEQKLEEIGNSFEIVHNHTYPEFINLIAAERLKTPVVTTIHAQATPELDDVLSLFKNTFLISISKAHRNLFKKTQFYETVYNGIPVDTFSYSAIAGDYLLWLGRLSKAKNKDGDFTDPKGIEWAIQLAEATGEKLVMGGIVEDTAFFNTKVKPHLNDRIQWLGPVSKTRALERDAVAKLMQKAKAFLMTINWLEPFGLVMAEAMACGAPIIAFNRGSVPELVVDGKTGFIVPPEEGLEGLKIAVEKIGTINREDCRKHVVEHFSLEKMVENYEKVYQKILAA